MAKSRAVQDAGGADAAALEDFVPEPSGALQPAQEARMLCASDGGPAVISVDRHMGLGFPGED
jgi:hypothetical protein